jgi:Transketolase, C-terminal subunit
MAAKEMRAVYAETLEALAAEDGRITVLEADLMRATGTGGFREKYPDRFYDVGVAEANMVGVAAGLATEGRIPFAATFGCFASRRVFDQFFVSCGYARLGVKLVGTDPGVTAAYNGGTHMPFEDLGLMREVPGLAIVEPSDPVSLAALVRELAAYPGPAYLRLHRKAVDSIYAEGERFKIGEGKLLREGPDVTLVALGALMVAQALRAADLLAAEGVSASVIDALSLKPLDSGLILEQARKTGAVVAAENHQASGGLGSVVAELLAETGAARLARVGVKDEFGEVGTVEYLTERFKLRAEDIASAARDLISHNA